MYHNKRENFTEDSEYEYYIIEMSDSLQNLNNDEGKQLQFLIYKFIRDEIPKRESENTLLDVILKNGKQGHINFIGIHY